MKSITTLLTVLICTSSFLIVSNSTKIQINSPITDSKINKGDTLKINANITSEQAIHDLKLTIETEENLIIFEDKVHTHQKNLNYIKSYPCNMKSKSKIKVKLACKDHSGQITASDSVWVKIK